MKDKKANRNVTVAVAMSGGVDSSVAAALLKKQGYNVVGFFMKNWSETAGLKYSDCPWIADRQDAMRAAAKLDIPFHTLEFEKEYKKIVLDYFFKEYQAGRTPNPDILCNEKIKFGVFLDKALELGAEYIATGHYARKKETPSPSQGEGRGEGWRGKIASYKLLKAKDKNKDQTYFLYRLNQEQLSRSMFPIGDYTKTEVRALAKKFGLPNFAKPDSQGVCFMGHIDLQKFLSQKIKSRPGDIVTEKGKVVGRHQGLHIYTIGQRKGIGVGGVGPFYVLKKDYKKNQLVITSTPKDKELFSKEIVFADATWIAGEPEKFPLKCFGRIRYREKLGSCLVRRGERSGLYKAVFKSPRWAVSGGQSIVLYKNGECLGGGVIA